MDPLHVTCTGCLDFAFQVTNDGSSDPTEPIFALILSNFAGFTTDAGYIDNSGDTNPVHVNRTAGGGKVGFSFATEAAVIFPNESTSILVVATNATNFDSNGGLHFAAFDGTENPPLTTDATGLFEPTPEPSSLLVAAIAFLTIAAFRKSRNLSAN